MKNYIVALFICLLPFSVQSQIKIEYSVGYGNYKMDDMQTELINLQNTLKTQYPLDIDIIDNFPGYLTYHIAVIYGMQEHEAGADFTYLTTAGKLAYSDYSGEIMNKLALNAYRIGLLYRYHFYQIGTVNKVNLSFYGEVSPGITFTNVKVKGHIKTNDEFISLDNKYLTGSNITGFSVLPRVGANLRLPYGIGIHVAGGYDFQMGSTLKQNKDVRVDWSGLRLEGGVSYQLPFIK
ncbi:MAG: hypothetical protein LUG18_05030 [Candidatus Azobacteroides sp.]|nr:hypothetical protein [Candidatus Azobacteroides sp.]